MSDVVADVVVVAVVLVLVLGLVLLFYSVLEAGAKISLELGAKILGRSNKLGI